MYNSAFFDTHHEGVWKRIFWAPLKCLCAFFVAAPGRAHAIEKNLFAGFVCFTSKWNYCTAEWQDPKIKLGDVVAQLVKATGRHQTEDAAVPSSNPAPPTVSWTGPGTMTVYHKTNLSMGGVSAWEKTKKNSLKINSPYCTCHSGIIETAVKAVSLTPWCMSPWCQWYHCAYCHCPCSDMHSGVIGTALTCTAVSLTLLSMSEQCQWHRWTVCRWFWFPHKKQGWWSYEKIFNKVGCTAVSLTVILHIYTQKGFNTCIRGKKS
jgi:hypothetical protein